MEIREDRWLTAIFGHEVFRIDAGPPATMPEHDSGAVRDVVGRHVAERREAMYYAKVDTAQVELVRQLSAAGMYVVDVNVTFGIESNSRINLSESVGVTIREVEPAQHRAVLDIAASCFRYSRFHLDPLVPDAIANRIKHDWILNYIRGERGERLFAAMIGERAAGFLAVLASESNGKRVRTIDLIGVGSPDQGRGVGQALGEFFIRQYAGQCDSLQVGTQAANVPSMRLYQKLGFSIIKTQYVLHMHVR